MLKLRRDGGRDLRTGAVDEANKDMVRVQVGTLSVLDMWLHWKRLLHLLSYFILFYPILPHFLFPLALERDMASFAFVQFLNHSHHTLTALTATTSSYLFTLIK